MAITEKDRLQAEVRMQEAMATQPHAVRARYMRRPSRIVVSLSNGLEIAFPPSLAEGLEGATSEELSEVEIDPVGFGLHWPRLDADLYVPSLLLGIFGSKRWMAAQMGAAGGRVQSAAKTKSSRENGRKGGRPRTAIGA